MNKLNYSQNRILQIALCVVLAIFCFFQLKPEGIYTDKSAQEIAQCLITRVSPEVYPAVDTVRIPAFLSLDPAAMDEIFFYRTQDAMSAGELLIVRFSTSEQKDLFLQSASARRQSQEDIYSGYAPEQAAMMENAVIDVQGNMALYYAGEDPSGMDEAFRQALKGAGACS